MAGLLLTLNEPNNKTKPPKLNSAANIFVIFHITSQKIIIVYFLHKNNYKNLK